MRKCRVQCAAAVTACREIILKGLPLAVAREQQRRGRQRRQRRREKKNCEQDERKMCLAVFLLLTHFVIYLIWESFHAHLHFLFSLRCEIPC